MHRSALSARRLASAAAVTCTAALIPVTALIPVAALAVTASPAAARPAGFQPAAASFTSPARGVVLGGVGCREPRPCRARLVATTDGGARWHPLTAPRAWLLNRGPVVSQVVFASRRNGWLYGQSGRRLWATHDGGAHWRKLSLGGGIVTLATSAGTAYAVIAAAGGRRDELLRSPAGQNAWSRVGTITGGFGSVLAVSGKAAWFGSSNPATGAGTLWATADGTHWHHYPFACPGRGYQLSAIAAASRSRVVFLCTDAQGMYHTNKEVLRSVDGGRTEHLTGHAPVFGDDTPGGFAVPRHRSQAITIAAVTPGPDFLYRSPNGGRTWAQITVPGTDGGVNIGSLAYQSRRAGWVVAGQPGVSRSRLLRTLNGGRSWHRVSF
jgi:hypothetical protein